MSRQCRFIHMVGRIAKKVKNAMNEKSAAVSKEVLDIAENLNKAGYEAFLVGGCVRDILLRRVPKDWDIATNAKPEEVQKIFTDSVYENDFGTVGIKTESESPALKVIEVTTFRKEGRYTDKRHPDEIGFAKTIEEDLSRRDFTVNALALRLTTSHEPLVTNIVDPFHGQKDLKAKVIRTVGKPEERFGEDALRLMRAVRFAAELDFDIETETAATIKKHAGLLEMIAKERIRDEFVKMIMTKNAMAGVQALEDYGMLKFIMPELREGVGVEQNLHHIYGVWEHNLRALDYAASKDYSLTVRLASLLHDVGKPRTKAGSGRNATFYAHEVVGAKMTPPILDRLHFSKKIIEDVTHLVRCHLFYYNVGEVTDAGVRRFINRVGIEYLDDLIRVREADRIGSGVPKAVPYKLRHLLFMVEKVRRDPVSPKMLAVKGDDVMKILNIPPGPRVGWILAALLEEVLDDPKKNTREDLETRIKELGKLSDAELKKISEKARETKNEFESDAEEEIKKRYYVK